MRVVFIYAKFAEEHEEGRQGDCVKGVLEIQESDRDCALILFYVLQRADEAWNLSPFGSSGRKLSYELNRIILSVALGFWRVVWRRPSSPFWQLCSSGRSDVLILKTLENGRSVSRRIISVACSLSEPWPTRSRWTQWIGSKPVQIIRFICAARGRLGVMGCRGFWSFCIDPLSQAFTNSHIVHLQARPPACSPTGALLHRCLPSNLSATTQGAIVKLYGASTEFCTLDWH